MVNRQATLKDVNPQQWVVGYAEYLKKQGKIVLPKWVDIAKTAVHKELPPSNPDWFYVHCAAVARNVYIRPGTGVQGLRKRYGSAKNGGYAPYHHARASRTVQRKCLQELERIGVLENIYKLGMVHRDFSSTLSHPKLQKVLGKLLISILIVSQ